LQIALDRMLCLGGNEERMDGHLLCGVLCGADASSCLYPQRRDLVELTGVDQLISGRNLVLDTCLALVYSEFDVKKGWWVVRTRTLR